ncbi:MAG: site-specific integrase [Pedosphaera sp.]|nr:site-specific integrase [Pedosphaera sp.]
MASIHQRPGSKFYHAAFRDASGRLVLRSTKQTDRSKALETALTFERTARRAESLTEEQARKVVSDLMERVGGGRIRTVPVADFLAEWLDGKTATKSGGTAERYRSTVAAFIKSLGSRSKVPVASIATRDVQNFVHARIKQGFAPGTVRLDAKIVSAAFNRARREGLIDTNPADPVELPQKDGIERGTFNATEIRMLVDAAEAEWKTLIMVAYFTGARMGDCVNLQWAQINFAKASVVFKTRKTKDNLELPLHPELQAHLESLAGDTAEKFILPGMAGKGPGGRRGLSESFKSIVRRAGLDLQEVQGLGARKVNRRTFHSLRHSHVSALANAGVSAELRMKITGHKSAEIHGGYTHHEREQLAAAMAKLPGIHATSADTVRHD